MKPHSCVQMWRKYQKLKLLHKKVLYYTYVYAMYVSNIVPDNQCFIWLNNGFKECLSWWLVYFKFMNFWNKFDNFFLFVKNQVIYSGRKPTSTSICCWHKIAIVLFIHPPYMSCEKKTLITWKKIHYFGSYILITFDTCLFS